MKPRVPPIPAKTTQADRRARTQAALIEAATNNLARFGYAEMVLERVASDAGYTRGALYHLFANKEKLTLAVVEWAYEAWHGSVGYLLAQKDDPIGTLIAVARGTAVYRRDNEARILSRLRAEFNGMDHPVGRAIEETMGHVVDDVTRIIKVGRRSGAIPPGPPPHVVALAYLGALEGVVNQLVGQEPYDELFAERTALGVLGLAPPPDSAGTV